MAVMDEFKEERAALKNAGFKKKLSYFLYYYKWHVIAGVLIAAGIGSIIYEMVTKKEYAFYAVHMNAAESETAAPEFRQGFLDYAGISSEKYETIFDTTIHISPDPDSMDESTMTSTQKLMVYVAAGEVDVMVSDARSIAQYANSEAFFDMRQLLTQKQLAEYEPFFYYVDMAVIREWNEAKDNMEYDYKPEFPDPSKPQEMKEPVPVGLFIQSPKLREAYLFREGDLVLGVYRNTKHLETALQYIDYLFEDA